MFYHDGTKYRIFLNGTTLGEYVSEEEMQRRVEYGTFMMLPVYMNNLRIFIITTSIAMPLELTCADDLGWAPPFTHWGDSQSNRWSLIMKAIASGRQWRETIEEPYVIRRPNSEPLLGYGLLGVRGYWNVYQTENEHIYRFASEEDFLLMSMA